jgi:hypothetical protein
MPGSTTSNRKKKERTLLYIRLSFAAYILMLAVLIANLFLFYNKDFITYEAILAGIAYLYNFRLVFMNMEQGRSSEMTFYFLSHIIVIIGVVFLLMADTMSANTQSQFNSNE